jgi:signal transduction histidine kinase
MNWFSLGLLVTVSVLNLLVGVVVLARDYRKIENIAFFGVMSGIAAWAFGIAGFIHTHDLALALLWAKAYYVAPIVIVFASVIFAQNFLHKYKVNPLINRLLFLSAGLLTAALIFNKRFVTDYIVLQDYGKQVVLNPREYMVYSAFLLLCFVVTIGLTYRKSSSITYGLVAKQQAKIFLLGYSASCIAGVFFNLVLPGLNNYSLIVVGPTASTLFALSVAYAIARHKLFDVRLVVARTLGYASSLLMLSLLYGLLVFGVANAVFHLHFSVGAQVFLSVATSFMAIVFGQFRKRFDRMTNKIFYRDAYEPQDLFDTLNRDLVSTVDIKQLLHKSTRTIASYLKSEYCLAVLNPAESGPRRQVGVYATAMDAHELEALSRLLAEQHEATIVTDNLEPRYLDLKERLRRNNVAVVVRMVTPTHRYNNGVGFILLGPKKSGNSYTTQDTAVLSTVAKELIIAIQNALRFEEIEHFNVTLQGRVNEATKELRRANEKLKALDEAKDDFISMASHQLRTPLTAIKGYSSMLLEGVAGDKLNKTEEQFLRQTFNSSQRMVGLVADLLNLSRLKTGKFVVERVPCNMVTVIEEELNQLQEIAASRDLTLTFEKPDQFPEVNLDLVKTHQVIMNFIDNAVYYTRQGGHIVVKLEETSDDVVLTVNDDGIGVPEAQQANLFTKFFRADNAQTARPDGTGIGLFMAKKAIEAQGGHIIFKSTHNVGSTFGFRLSKSEPTSAASSKTVAQSAVPAT